MEEQCFFKSEIEDIEEHVADASKYKDIPTKVFTELPTDTAVKVIDDKFMKQKSFRKDMKKAKVHVVRVLKDCPKRLTMEADAY